MIKQIKVIGIISSPRVNGSTATLVREALKAAEQEGARVTEIFLKKYRIEYCRGCLTCMQQGNCVITDDMFNLKQIVSQADGIILSSPNYANSHNAIMKNFLERLGLFEFLTSSLFGGKYVAGISTAGGGGAKRVAKGLTNLTRNGIFKRSYVSGVLGTGVHGRQVEEVPNALKQAYKLGKKVVLDIKKQKKYPLQNFWGRHFIDFFIKSSFKRYIKRDRQTATKAVFENLALRQLI